MRKLKVPACAATLPRAPLEEHGTAAESESGGNAAVVNEENEKGARVPPAVLNCRVVGHSTMPFVSTPVVKTSVIDPMQGLCRVLGCRGVGDRHE